MKKFLVFTIVMFFGLAVSAHAALQKITFDETDIIIGDVISDQYIGKGFTFDYPNVITTGSAFNNSFDSDGNILQYTSKQNLSGTINLSSLCDSLSFQYRRPGSSGDISVKLFNNSTLIDSFDFTWNSGK